MDTNMTIANMLYEANKMPYDDVTLLIKKLRAVQARKALQRQFHERMNDLIQEAREQGFEFVDHTCGYLWREDEFTVFDNE
jgi:hypothetical protein